MTENDYLNASDMKRQCALAKKYLKKDNDALDIIKTKVNEFINDEKNFEGRTGDALRNHMDNYITIISSMILVNEIDMEDFEKLSERVGNKVLSGENIFSQLSSIKNSIIQAEERAEKYNFLMKDTINPLMDLYYENKKKEYKSNVRTYEKLYKKWNEKVEEYDEIELQTKELFCVTEEIRNILKKALDSQGKNFNANTKTYSNTSSEVNDWKKELLECFLKYSKDTYIGLYKSGENYLNIVDDAGKIIGYGGNQSWFADDPEYGYAIENCGCGLIAVINFLYYAEGKKEVRLDDYKKRVYDFIDENISLNVYLKSLSHYIGLGIPCPKVMPGIANVESMLEDYLIGKTKYKNVDWQWGDGNYIEQIELQLNKKIPVILCFWGSDEVEELQLYKKNGNKMICNTKTSKHYVTIIGIQKLINPNSFKKETYLEVSSWGEIYYIKYDEFLKYKKDCYAGNLDKINDIASNISIIK